MAKLFMMNQVHSHIGKIEADHQVNRVGRARAHEVGDLLVHEVFTGNSSQSVASDGANPSQFFVTVGIRLTVLDDFATHHRGAF